MITALRQAVAEDFTLSGPVLLALILLICLDMLGGLMVAFAKREVSSSVSREGVARKVLTIIVVAACMILDAIAPTITLPEIKVGATHIVVPVTFAGVIAFFYCITEIISITEKVARLHGRVPRFLKRYLVKVRDAIDDMGSEETK